MNGPTVNLTRQTDGDMALAVTLHVTKAPTGPVMLGMGCGSECSGAVDISGMLQAVPKSGDKHGAKGVDVPIAVRLSCLRTAGADIRNVSSPLELTSSAALSLSIVSATLEPGEGPPTCPMPPPS